MSRESRNEKRYKKNLKFSNDKLEQYEVLQKQPQDVVTIHQEIEFLRKTLSKLIGSIGKLNKVLRCKKCSTGKFGNGYKGKKYDHDEDTIDALGKEAHTKKIRRRPMRTTFQKLSMERTSRRKMGRRRFSTNFCVIWPKFGPTSLRRASCTK
ncbi:hypothetical protein JHK82_022591 [Glycine max]|nr:hypothetical protein JHK82_022591 [Glycine max]